QTARNALSMAGLKIRRGQPHESSTLSSGIGNAEPHDDETAPALRCAVARVRQPARAIAVAAHTITAAAAAAATTTATATATASSATGAGTPITRDVLGARVRHLATGRHGSSLCRRTGGPHP